MLPTHVVRMDYSEPEQSHGAIAGPSTSRSMPHAVRSHAAHERKPSLQTKIFGPRGVAAFTIDTGPLALDTKGKNRSANGRASTAPSVPVAKPPRWQTLEFRVYALVFLIMVPVMVWVPVQLSNPSNPNYPRFRHHLKQGWIAGRLMDDSDFQYRSFRDYLFPLLGIMSVYLLVSKISSSLSSSLSGSSATFQPSNAAVAPSPRPNRLRFLLGFTAIFITALHGTNALKLLAVVSLNFAVARTLGGSRIAPVALWTLNVGALFAVHWNDGFKYAKMSDALAFLDNYQGLLPRWQINFNITMLRLVSFALDLHWARQGTTPGGDAAQRRNGQTSAEANEAGSRERAATSRPLHEYNYANYLAYVLYPPLFIAGPIMTFNDFTSQLYRPLSIPHRSTLTYAVRFLACLLTMEFILHFTYVVAIKDSKAWDGATPMELSMIGFWNLIIVWLKLLIPWRFFRLWAMADGVDAPENMVRCMANNYSTLGFWRSWHRSYNLRIVRYIYVPVGGAKNAIPATLLVFTFVALWHDLSLKLLTWGWLVTFFIVPELVARNLLSEKRYGSEPWYRHVCALGGVGNVLMMMTANLVGFAIGTDGMRYLWGQLLGNWAGAQFMFSACAVLFVGVQAMFEYREEEIRRGIVRKC